MPSPNMIGFGLNDPSVTDQQIQLARAQQLAQLLQSQAAEPINAGNAPMSWTQGAAKLVAALGARRQNQKADTLTKSLAGAQQAALDRMFGALTSGDQPQPQLPQAAPEGQPLPAGGGVMANSATPGAAALAQSLAPQQPNSRLKEQALLQMVGPQEYGKAELARREKEREEANRPTVLPYGARLAIGPNIVANGAQETKWENVDGQMVPVPTHPDLGAAPYSKTEPLHAVIGDDGKPVLLPASKAAGKTPYTASIFSSNAPLLPAEDPQVASFKSQVLAGNATLANVPMNLRASVAQALNDTSKGQFTPTAASKFTMAASRITHQFTNMSAYKLTADGKPYLERIDAAMKSPGSVSDQDLLDSLTKLNTGGNAVTDAQVSLITHGKSFSDMANTFLNKFKSGGVLSPDQRQQIHDIAYQIYENYKAGYQPIYEKAAAQLTEAGIPKAFWTIPDLNSINSDSPSAAAPAAPGSHPADIQAILDSLKK